MTTVTFLILLSAYSILNGLVVEAYKNLTKNELSYNIVALGFALIIGFFGTIVYYQLNSIEFTTNNKIYAALLGLASGLTSMVGYDKVKQAIEQFTEEA